MKDQIIKNPWIDLVRDGGSILKVDSNEIEDFNEKCKKEDHKIKTDLLPEPFIGNLVNPALILLSLNPGCSNHKKAKELHDNDTEFKEAVHKNLLHQSSECPFYYLDNRFSKTLGYKWWNKKLKSLIEGIEKSSGISAEEARDVLGKKLAVIEYFPYPSKRYKSLPSIIPSQEYSFQLAKTMIKRNIPIIIMRKKRLWLKTFEDYDCDISNIIHVYNFQNPNISADNLAKDISNETFRSICANITNS